MEKINICMDLGFCHGVRNAIWSSILSISLDNRVSVFGNLIHNERVLNDLFLSNVNFVKTIEEIIPDSTVIIPAHGITKDIYSELKKRTVKIIDMTCPVVLKMRRNLNYLLSCNYKILLFGRKDHPEIISAVSFAEDGNIHIIESISDIKKLNINMSKIALLSQTTSNNEEFEDVKNYLRSLSIEDLNICDTICPTVKERQENTYKLSQKSDLVMVVGDKKSSNTLSLLNISKKTTDTCLIESHKPFEFDKDLLNRIRESTSIAISSGTSTPYFVIDELQYSLSKILNSGYKQVPVLVIYGPTAVGKTNITESLTKIIDSEIISCDSMQIYKELSIGTAKPINKDSDIKYHLIDLISINEDYSVADFRKYANKAILEIIDKNKIPIISGGSYLYLSSLIEGLFEMQISFDPAVREELYLRSKNEGLTTLYNELLAIDPEVALKVGPNDEKRIIRGLEVYNLTRTKLSTLQKEKTFSLPYFFIKIGLVRPVEELYKRIDQRVDEMIKQGLLDEIKSLINKGYIDRLMYVKPHGYREMIDYFNNLKTLDEALELMKKNTRNYAKRQLSWLKQRSDFHLLNVSAINQENIMNSINNIINSSRNMVV